VRTQTLKNTHVSKALSVTCIFLLRQNKNHHRNLCTSTKAVSHMWYPLTSVIITIIEIIYTSVIESTTLQRIINHKGNNNDIALDNHVSHFHSEGCLEHCNIILGRTRVRHHTLLNVILQSTWCYLPVQEVSMPSDFVHTSIFVLFFSLAFSCFCAAGTLPHLPVPKLVGLRLLKEAMTPCAVTLSWTAAAAALWLTARLLPFVTRSVRVYALWLSLKPTRRVIWGARLIKA
jgi:hypothetical protein